MSLGLYYLQDLYVDCRLYIKQEVNQLRRERDRCRSDRAIDHVLEMKNGGQAHQHVQHFSHQHPLKLSNNPSHVASSCAGCKLICAGSTGSIYTCTTGCSFFLHTSCAQMPQQITHPFDQSHVLPLLPIPTYPGGLFKCNACWKDGSGFSYHCGPCNIDLHMDCASMPLALPPHQQFHHPHQLNLTFSMRPGSPNDFTCDICNKLGHTEWLYWCVPCDFTAHLACARSKPRPYIPVMPNYAPPPTYARQSTVLGRNNGFTNSSSGQVNGLAHTVIQSFLGGVGGGGGGSGSSGFDFGNGGIGGSGDLSNSLNFFG
uniref:uncharacterized protein LOC101306865 n=1 Tax=Fragaria vesca subsp. vesca TaxID=101020 RepID=UPI0005C99F2D|nr:PREDICTED: uncharacterized protein LOC101306865 [Fragaria vesca subsp. vesca]